MVKPLVDFHSMVFIGGVNGTLTRVRYRCADTNRCAVTRLFEMRLHLNNWLWRRRMVIVVAVVLPCLLWWGVREAGSWRPRLFVENSLIGQMTFSPTEPLLAMVVWKDSNLKVQVWDTYRTRLLWENSLPPEPTLELDKTTVSFSPDGKMLATKSSYIKFWDAHNGDSIRSIKDSQEPRGGTLQFSSDGAIVSTSGQKVKFYDVKTGKCLRTLSPPLKYDVSKLSPLSQLPKSGFYRRLAYLKTTPNSKTVVASLEFWKHDGGPYSDQELWLGDRNEPLRARLSSGSHLLAFSPDSRFMVTDDSKDIASPYFQLWDLDSKKRVLSFETRAEGIGTWTITQMLFSHDSTRLYGAIFEERSESSLFVICVWDVATGRLLRTFNPSPVFDQVGDVHFTLSGDDSILAILAVQAYEKDTNFLKLWRVR